MVKFYKSSVMSSLQLYFIFIFPFPTKLKSYISWCSLIKSSYFRIYLSEISDHFCNFMFILWFFYLCFADKKIFYYIYKYIFNAMSFQDVEDNCPSQISFFYYLWIVIYSWERYWSGFLIPSLKFPIQNFLSFRLVALQG